LVQFTKNGLAQGHDYKIRNYKFKHKEHDKTIIIKYILLINMIDGNVTVTFTYEIRSNMLVIYT
jgi:hypothetical protein